MKTMNWISAAVLAAGLGLGQNAGAQTYNNDKMPESVNVSGYNTAIGVRVGGTTSGITIKDFITDRSAFEGIVGIWPGAFGLTGLYERYANAFNSNSLNWYYGMGAHATLGTSRVVYVYSEDHKYYRYNSGNLALGIDGILGLEYKIPQVPFAFSLDIKPFIEGNTGGGAYISADPGLGIKVAF